MQVPENLLLVSQIQRSGGSLMSQLFDGHPQLMAHPFEIHIGFPKKWDYPILTAEQTPEEWFEILYEKKIDHFIANGYCKPGGNKSAQKEVFKFSFNKPLMTDYFVNRVKKQKVFNRSKLICIYFESFFKAWTDYSFTGEEIFISGFTPRLALVEKSREELMYDFPDARIVTIVRDPISWYSSSSRHNINHTNIQFAMQEWSLFAKKSLHNTRTFKNNFLGITFESLVLHPKSTMHQICKFAGITFDKCLLKPTFFGNSILPNSSFDNDKKGIQTSMIDRSSQLSKSETEFIERKYMDLYNEIKESFLNP